MRVGVTGASGFIGRHLIARLRADGHTCVAFSRQPSQRVEGCAETRTAAPDRELDASRLDAIVNLAGETIMGRWTAAKKRRVLASRVRMTERVVKAMARTADGPRTLINASAIGFYGDRGEEAVDESSSPGTGFLAEVTQQWETAAQTADAAGVRATRLRVGFVLGRDGGAFALMRPIFSLGLGGPLGSGRQWISPIHVDDVSGLIAHLLEHAETTGAFNAVCPEPVRNADFTRALGRALKRPAVLPVPGWALKLALGEMSHLPLDSQRVLPKRTLESGYAFKFPGLPSILADLTSA